MKDRIVYVENNFLDPYQSFGLEYYLTAEKTFDDSTVLLFWRTEPTLMVGRYQNTYSEINTEYADQKGINIVRRMSGGGTIYTDLGGWQYSFITRTDKNEISFAEYIAPVIDALQTVGVKAEFNGRNDLVINGKKFSGTAQYMHNGFTVHHGSLLYNTDLEELVKSTTVDEFKIVSKGIKSVRDRVTNISEHMEAPVSAEEFRELIVKHLIGDDGIRYNLTQYDMERIDYYAREKFDNWESKFGKNPPFNVVKTGHFEGGNIEMKLDVAKGRIVNADIYGDFFGNIDKSAIEKALKGCEYDSDSVRKRLKDNDFDSCIYRITAEDIADMF